MRESLLDIRGLSTHFFRENSTVKAVDGVNLLVYPGETVAVVGESGCGKSTLAYSVFRIVSPPGRIVAGTITFRGLNLLSLPEPELNRVRGAKISLIFQDAFSALNPVIRVGEQIAEILRCHLKAGRVEAKRAALTLIERVHLPNPEGVYRSYPHQLSGGQRQRIMIAMAVACRPALIVADEPTSSLDVSIQGQIIALLGELKKEYNLSLLLITHDFGVVASMADRVAVMYAGKVVETADAASLFAGPLHPYTSALLHSIPRLPSREQDERVKPLQGSAPDMENLPPGCAFEPRCPVRMDECCLRVPSMASRGEGCSVSCLKYP